MDIQGTSLVAGNPAQKSGRAFSAFDPALGTEIAPDFYEASPTDVDAAMRSAADAFGDYRARPAEARASFLEAIAAEIESLGDALVARATAERAPADPSPGAATFRRRRHRGDTASGRRRWA